MLATPQPRLTSPSLSSSTSSGSSSATPPTPKRQLSLNNKHQSTHAPFNPSLDSVPRTVEHSPVSYDFPAGAGDELSEARELRMPQPRTRRSQQQAAFGSSAGMRTAGGSTSSAGRSDAGNQLEAKVVILGSQGVGKTSIVHRYTSGHFSYSLSSTIGASFLTKKLVVDGCKVRLQIWDTAGQERFRSMAPLYYRGALAAILVYDITNADSFNDVKIWLEELRRNMSPDLIIHVVGSKGDLAPTLRAVDIDTARRQIAEWVSFPPYPSPGPSSSLATASTSSLREPSPSPRPRARTLSTRANPSITTSPPLPSTNSNLSSIPSLPTLTARVRKLSTKVKSQAASTANSGLNLSSTSIGEGSSSSGGEGMVRSGSKLGLGVSALGMGRRKSAEEERRSLEEAERERVDELVRECGIELSEVSAKDDSGIEDLFLLISRRLVERKSQIESSRVLRSRDSIMLSDADLNPPPASSWCC